MKSLCTNCGKATRPVCPDCVKHIARREARAELLKVIDELRDALANVMHRLCERPSDD